MPVVKAEPPVTSGEVAGSVSERALLERCSPARRTSPTPWSSTWRPGCRSSGPARRSAARHELERGDAVLVTDEGKPVGVLTRADLLGFLSN